MAWYWILGIVIIILGVIVGLGYWFLRWVGKHLSDDFFNSINDL